MKKKRAIQNRIWELIVEKKEITDYKEISNKSNHFTNHSLNGNFSETNFEKQQFLNSLSTKTLTNEQDDLWVKQSFSKGQAVD